MNRIQAVDAANVIMHIRPDWQQPGRPCRFCGVPDILERGFCVYCEQLFGEKAVARTPQPDVPKSQRDRSNHDSKH